MLINIFFVLQILYDSTQAAGYGSSINGVNGSEDVTKANVMENGITSNAGIESALLHQPLGSSDVYSAFYTLVDPVLLIMID